MKTHNKDVIICYNIIDTIYILNINLLLLLFLLLLLLLIITIDN